MTYSALWLSQAQFFMSLSFMLLFLLLEIGLAWALAFFKLRALRGDTRWTQAYRFWVRIFALSFIIAFGSAVPVMIQFGSLWPGLMDRIGNVASPLLAAAVLTIFVFKSCFVGAMLFGQRYVSQRVHAVLVVMVAIGVTAAALWPVMLFSWMRTPAGAFFANGTYVVAEWTQVAFNPSFPWYAALLLALAFSSSSLFILGITALQSLRRQLLDADRAVFAFAARASVLSLIVLAGTGFAAASVLSQHEPARAAAAAGYWKSGAEPSIAIIGWPDTLTQTDTWAWRWSNVGGIFLARGADGTYRGLDQFSGMTPPLALTFWSARIAMLATIGLLAFAAIAWWRSRARGGDPAFLSRWLRQTLVAMSFGGWVVAVAGFAHVAIGAHPYAVAETVTFNEVLTSASGATLAAGGLAMMLVYAFCLIGFLQLLWHGARYGVVPVARHRGRA